MTILTSALAASVVATTSSAKPTTTSGLSFFLRFLLHGHQAAFFGGFRGFFGGSFNRSLVLPLAIEVFGLHQLLPGLGEN